MQLRVRKILVSVALMCVFAGATSGADQRREVRVPSGPTTEIWFGFNVSGRLNYSVRSRDGTNRITATWITYPFFLKQEVTMTDDGGMDIPISAWRGSISAKLVG